MFQTVCAVGFSFERYGDHWGLHSFPTRRSSDLQRPCIVCMRLMTVSEAGTRRSMEATTPTLVIAYGDRKSTRLNSSHGYISYAVFCLKKKNDIHGDTVLDCDVVIVASGAGGAPV